MTDEEKIELIVEQNRNAAYARALKGQAIIGVASVFVLKGVPRERADAEAEKLIAEAVPVIRRRKLPRQIIGWGFIAFGVGTVLFSLVGSGGTLLVVPGGLILLGAAVLWSDEIFSSD